MRDKRSASHRKRVGNEARLLALVASKRADGGAGAGFATGVGDFGAENRAQSRFHESPCAHVFWFFLAPDELRIFWKWLEHFAQLFFRQRIKLLDPNDRGIVNLAIASVLEQIVIDFAGAKDDPLHVVGRTSFGRAENFFESASG